MLESIKLEAFDGTSPGLHEAVDIYVQVWQRNPEASLLFFRKNTRLEHFRGYLARVRGRAVGMVFGTISEPGQWWHDNVTLHLGTAHPALQNAWVLSELAVLEPYQGNGIGSRLHDAIVAAQPADNMLLSTQKANQNARRFYENRGWSYLHNGFSFNPNRPHYVIMHKHVQPQHS
jgi:ribosomal protein S18 acetylase RimI-like enzyme